MQIDKSPTDKIAARSGIHHVTFGPQIALEVTAKYSNDNGLETVVKIDESFTKKDMLQIIELTIGDLETVKERLTSK